MDKIKKIFSETTWRPVQFVSNRYGGGICGFLKACVEAITVFVRRGPRQVYNQILTNVHASDRKGVDKAIITSRLRQKLNFSPCKVILHHQPVAIVICVHNALEDVCHCLHSVVNYTTRPFRIIIVDDGSATETQEHLACFAQRDNVTLIRNQQAKGYTLAANQGMQEAEDDYVVLLNSDTIVSNEWLDRMIQCAISCEAIGIVGPLSNTASWQSIPNIEKDGDWAPNPLPTGIDIPTMAGLVAAHSPGMYPRLSFLNGFCLLIKQQVIQEIGYFDEETFARGFCEENDYCLRARMNQWELAVADDVYVYHSQSKSYSDELRKKLVEASYRDFVAKFGAQIIDKAAQQCRFDKVMLGIRARAYYLTKVQQLVDRGKVLWQGRKIAIVLPAAVPGGGSNIVIAEALAMIKMGVDVTIVNLAMHQQSFSLGYPSLKIPVRWAANEGEVAELCTDFDVVIATASHSVKWLLPLAVQSKHTKFAYYIQDYEPYFHRQDSSDHNEAVESYSAISGLIRFTKTKWNQDKLMQELNLDSTCIGISVNNNLFRPYPRSEKSWPTRPLRIIAMIRPNSPRRGSEMTMRVFKRISELFTGQIELVIFGVEIGDPELDKLETSFDFTNLGVISREEVVALMTESDIFTDFSTYQAMGLTAMEAMCCGLAVILTNNGGVQDFARPDKNCILVDTSSFEESLKALHDVIQNHDLRFNIQREAITDMAQYSSEKCAHNILSLLFD